MKGKCTSLVSEATQLPRNTKGKEKRDKHKEEKMKKNLSAVLILFLISYSCIIKDNDVKSNEIILQTIGEAIDSITYGALDSAILVHTEKYPDNIKEITVKSFLEKESKIDFEEKEILGKLLFAIQDSVKVKLNNYKFKHNFITEDAKYYNHSSYFGYINLSNPIENNNSSLACYYLAINCFQINEAGCSVGFLILAERQGVDWKLKKHYPLWTGSSWEKIE
jgi:hypothetical protein